MNKCTQLLPFVQDLFDDRATARKATEIVAGILKARSPRISEIAREMKGNEVANYKCVQRFLEANEPQEVLLRLFREEAEFVIGDPTEMPRPQAKQTEYVGTLSDGETSGCWLLLLATPFHGRALPCYFVRYSSKTINQDATSRNQHHFTAFAKVKELLGDRPWVLDREFSYLELLENLAAEGVNFVIRLKSLLNLHKLMNKRRTLMEKIVALVLIVYAIALVLGEILREHLFPLKSLKHKLYSGPFLFLKLKPKLAPPVLSRALSAFSLTVCPVRTYV